MSIEKCSIMMNILSVRRANSLSSTTTTTTPVGLEKGFLSLFRGGFPSNTCPPGI